MLSESAKERLNNALTGMLDAFGSPEVIMKLYGDPKTHIQMAIDANPMHPDAISLAENREEAERMVAGYLGLM